MAKQSFSVGQVLTANQMLSLQQTAMLGGSATAKTASYTLVAADAGTVVSVNSTSATTITVNTGLFSAGDTVTIQNWGSGLVTITAGTATVNTAGSLIVPQYDGGVLYFTSASAAIYFVFVQAGAVSPLTTKGDLYTYSTTDTRIGVGANDTILTADSSTATGLKWAAPAGGGKVLQVIQDDLTSNFSTTNTAYTDTGLTVTITPSSATSKILVMVSCPTTEFIATTNTGDLYGYFGVFRDTTQLTESSPGVISFALGTSPLMGYPFAVTYLDSPATTSATTYKLRAAAQSSRTTKIAASAQNIASIIVMEIGA